MIGCIRGPCYDKIVWRFFFRYGVTTDGHTQFINASTCTLHYRPEHPALCFDLPLGRAASSGPRPGVPTALPRQSQAPVVDHEPRGRSDGSAIGSSDGSANGSSNGSSRPVEEQDLKLQGQEVGGGASVQAAVDDEQAPAKKKGCVVS